MEKEADPKFTKQEEEALNVVKAITLKPEVVAEMTTWIDAMMQLDARRRQGKMEEIERHRKTLRGVNPNKPLALGASNVSVPLIMWVASSISARLAAGVLRARQYMSIRPAGKEREGDADLARVTKNLTSVMAALIKSRRAFNGKEAIERAAAEQTRWGLGSWKVGYTEDRIQNVAPLTPDSDPVRSVKRGSIKWQHIPYDDLVYFDGYNADVMAMPFVGYKSPKSWGELKQWAALGHYYKDAVAAVEKFYRDDESEQTPLAREHDIVELYADYDINEDGFMEAVVIDWHIKAKKILRVAWNQYNGYRPIIMVQFDFSDDLRDTDGQGVCEKLKSPQEEANMIHNIAIEAAKRGGAHLVITRSDSGAEEELEDDEPVMPSTRLSTENPDDDVKVHPLGDPRAAEPLIGLEELNRMYATRLLGMDEGRVGNIESGKRVPLGLGLPIMREGKTMIERGLNALAAGLEESIYLSLELMQKRMPLDDMLTVLNREDIVEIQNIVFTMNAEKLRTAFVVTANARDAAADAAERKTELFTLNQFLITFYERLMSSVSLLVSPQVPQPAKDMMLKVIEKMLNAINALLNTLDTIQDPAEVLLSMGEIRTALESANAAAAAAAPGSFDPLAPQG